TRHDVRAADRQSTAIGRNDSRERDPPRRRLPVPVPGAAPVGRGPDRPGRPAQPADAPLDPGAGGPGGRGRPPGRRALYALGLWAAGAAVAGAQLAAALAAARVGLALARDLRGRLYGRLQRPGVAYFDRTPVGAILPRLTDDVAAVQALVAGPA